MWGSIVREARCPLPASGTSDRRVQRPVLLSTMATSTCPHLHANGSRTATIVDAIATRGKGKMVHERARPSSSLRLKSHTTPPQPRPTARHPQGRTRAYALCPTARVGRRVCRGSAIGVLLIQPPPGRKKRARLSLPGMALPGTADRYRRGRRLGEGAFGEVMEGTDTVTGAAVALKRVYIKDAGDGREFWHCSAARTNSAPRLPRIDSRRRQPVSLPTAPSPSPSRVPGVCIPGAPGGARHPAPPARRARPRRLRRPRRRRRRPRPASVPRRPRRRPRRPAPAPP